MILSEIPVDAGHIYEEITWRNIDLVLQEDKYNLDNRKIYLKMLTNLMKKKCFEKARGTRRFYHILSPYLAHSHVFSLCLIHLYYVQIEIAFIIENVSPQLHWWCTALKKMNKTCKDQFQFIFWNFKLQK